jgi:ubiquinone/menaquinone biosynthesis C-methylase UbiE
MNANAYVGSELALFAEARNWKRYWHNQIARYVNGTVLEVGAGSGNNTLVFSRRSLTRWVCLEPDFALCAELRNRIGNDTTCDIVAGTLAAISEEPRFDTILYLDVLEHIEMDFRQLALSARMLKPGGHLIVLSPAHPWLYSPFDKAIGHFRRYTQSTLRSAAPKGLRLVKCRYLDCAGLTLSSGNALLLKQSMPTRRQILLWDRFLIPISRCVDPLLSYSCGKSVLGIWCNEPG